MLEDAKLELVASLAAAETGVEGDDDANDAEFTPLTQASETDTACDDDLAEDVHSDVD
jgi:hypothetical protein